MKIYFQKVHSNLLSIDALALMSIFSMLFMSSCGEVNIGIADRVTISSPISVVSGEIELDEHFTAINLSFPVTVHIVENQGNTLSYSMDSWLFDILNVSIQNGVLYINTNNVPVLFTGINAFDYNMYIYVSAGNLKNTLEAVNLSGISTLYLGNISPKRFIVNASGSSDLVGTVITNYISLHLSGSSDVALTLHSGEANITLSGSSDAFIVGSSDSLALTASGSSNAYLLDFIVQSADITASGSSDVSVHVTGSLDITASGFSDVIYAGNPSIGRREETGSSDIRSIN